MEAILSQRPFLMGARPVEADFGFFGSMFRHFFSDPTPAAIMRARAPHVLAWVTRLWSISPEEIAQAKLPDRIEPDLAPLLGEAASGYLPYLAANERAVAEGASHARYEIEGIGWKVPASPYRAHCLSALRAEFAALDPAARESVSGLLGEAAAILAPPAGNMTTSIVAPGAAGRPLDRQWRAG